MVSYGITLGISLNIASYLSCTSSQESMQLPKVLKRYLSSVWPHLTRISDDTSQESCTLTKRSIIISEILLTPDRMFELGRSTASELLLPEKRSRSLGQRASGRSKQPTQSFSSTQSLGLSGGRCSSTTKDTYVTKSSKQGSGQSKPV